MGVKINKLHMTVEEQAEQELAEAQAARAQAVQDYNIMMGNLEDPAEDEEEEEGDE